MLPKGQQSELTSYLSRRRNTTGSISLNKIVDLKNTSSGNALKLSAASSNSNNRLSTESKANISLSSFVIEFLNRYFSNCGRFRSIDYETTDTS